MQCIVFINLYKLSMGDSVCFICLVAELEIECKPYVGKRSHFTMDFCKIILRAVM